VPNAENIFPLVNKIQTAFELIIASKDWHPPNHRSFAKNNPTGHVFDAVELNGCSQILWPTHCVQGTEGAKFHPKLNTHRIKKIIYKGTDPEIDSYSAFFDNRRLKKTGLDAYLRDHQVGTLYALGLATDYCVQYTVLDALQLGFKTFVILDACFGINKNPNDVAKAIKNMTQAGAITMNSHKLLRSLSAN
jgi:nicotinamidase/pyrazinamidase